MWRGMLTSVEHWEHTKSMEGQHKPSYVYDDYIPEIQPFGKSYYAPISDQSRFSGVHYFLTTSNLIYWVGFGTVMAFKTHM